jgi:hypothetical protein
MPVMGKGGRDTSSQFTSNLPNAAHRFLSQAMAHALFSGWRTPEDFLRHFGPDEIMRSLEDAPELRTELLVRAAGVNEKIAKKKSTSSASEDLRLALNEGITDPTTVMSLFPADDRVRYLDAKKLWAFLVEGEFWTITAKRGAQEHDRACKRMTFLIENALGEHLINLKELADGISFREISTRLPVPKLQKVVEHALSCSRMDVALSEEVLLEVIPLGELVEYVPLELLWRNVLLAKVARPGNFVDDAAAGAENQAPAQPARAVDSPSKESARSSNKPASSQQKPSAPAPAPPPVSARPPEADSVGAARPASVDPQETEARREVTSRLREIERLPPSHETLSVSILHSIDGMYADLMETSDDEEREECIRDAFPNETHLRTAMIALIELLDPTINTDEPVIRDADLDALVKVVVFEERRRDGKRASAVPAPRMPSRPPSLPSSPPPLPPGPPPLPALKSAR